MIAFYGGNDPHGNLLDLVSAMRQPGAIESVTDRSFVMALTHTLIWTAASIRSGVHTYYEALPTSDQAVVADVLRSVVGAELANWYERGMGFPRGALIDAVDTWITTIEDRIYREVHQVARARRDLVLALTS